MNDIRKYISILEGFEPKIYTVGHTENYLKYLSNMENPKKLGPRESLEQEDGTFQPYLGGIAFRTIDDAIKWKDENNHPNYSPFILDGNWDTDVWYDSSSGHHRINKDLIILGPA